MKNLAKRRLISALSRYDQQMEPLRLRLDSSTNLRPLLHDLFDRLEQEHSDDPHFIEKIRGFRLELQSLIQKNHSCVLIACSTFGVFQYLL